MDLKSNKAITLVALIITIIILLILAGVSLSMVLGDNGLINKAQSSVDKYQQSANNEQAMLNSIEDYFKEYMPGEEMPLPDGWDGTKVTAISDGKHNIIPVPKDFYYVGGNLGNGVIISDNPADKYDGTVDKTTWEYTTSLVGNQFVWIPCTEAEYHKTDWGSESVTGNYVMTETSDEEKEKVLKYGGFYVARYEAGLADGIPEFTTNKYPSWGNNQEYDVLGIPKSKAGQVPWNFIQQKKAKINSESMYASSDTVESVLITGTQWDVMLNKLIGKTNQNGLTFTENDLRHPEGWGNVGKSNISYKGRAAMMEKDTTWFLEPFSSNIITSTTYENEKHIFYTTGASKIAEAYHIYDIAGNLMEYSDEYDPSGYDGVVRGMHACEYRWGACFRGTVSVSWLDIWSTFRIVLYIK